MIWVLELGFWLWLFLGGFACLGIVSHEQESPLLALISVVLFALGLQFLFGVPVWQSIWGNPLWVVVLLAGFFAIGLGYSVFWKWRRYCRKEAKAQADRIRSAVGREHNEKTFDQYLDDTYENKLHPANHKARIINWILTWPFGLLWTVLNDPINWIAREVYALSGRTLKTISDQAIRSAKD